MLTDLQKQDYIDETSRLVTLMCRARQWDAFTEGEVAEWLKNFHDVSGKYFALKILEKSLYYSDDDIVALLRFGLFEKIFGKEMRDETSPEELFLTRLCFVTRRAFLSTTSVNPTRQHCERVV